ncbi:hypothetical protein ACTXLR_02875 [Psychrobacter faecalis]|uniref:hypothetical protein n=1 Tax=Psychrobacter faecalis TaxID=180588 RepID=UPI003FD46BA5
MSSLQEASSKPINIINSILMSFNHPDGKRKNLIIEGKTDIKLFKNFINETQVKVRAVTGKDNVLKVMNDFPVDKKYFIHAVADADFDHILDRKDERERNKIYLTDFHDMEIIMVLSDSFDRLFNEYRDYSVENDSMNANELKSKIFEICKELGKIRYLNYINNYELKFKNISYDDCITFKDDSLILDLDVLLHKLIQRSEHGKVSVDALKMKLMELEGDYFQLEQICCGHDFTKLLAIFLKESKDFEGKNHSADKLESSLRVSFSINNFKYFELYKKLHSLGMIKI